MAVFALQMQHFKQIFQFILPQSRTQKAYQMQAVEIVTQLIRQRRFGHLAPQVVGKNVNVIVGIMPQEHCSSGIIHKALQGFPAWKKRLISAFFDDRINDITKHFGDFAVAFQME